MSQVLGLQRHTEFVPFRGTKETYQRDMVCAKTNLATSGHVLDHSWLDPGLRQRLGPSLTPHSKLTARWRSLAVLLLSPMNYKYIPSYLSCTRYLKTLAVGHHREPPCAHLAAAIDEVVGVDDQTLHSLGSFLFGIFQDPILECPAQRLLVWMAAAPPKICFFCGNMGRKKQQD